MQPKALDISVIKFPKALHGPFSLFKIVTFTHLNVKNLQSPGNLN